MRLPARRPRRAVAALRRVPVCGCALACMLGLTAATPAAAQPAGSDEADALDDVVVSASREAQRSFDAPAAVQSIGRTTIREAGPGVHLSEPLSRLPGVVALDRQNWAQDPQLSIRGFGARATFGIRGVRLLVDGIPATMPDGQGQASAVDLAAASRIEVLRGPLAQLHGNAAGGVVQVFSRRGEAPGELGAETGAGSFGLRRHALSATGAPGGVSGALDASWLSTDGYREHSAAERRLLNATVSSVTPAGTRWTIVAHGFDQPRALDPGGLTRAQLEADPRQASPAALAQDARKTVSQGQAGLLVEHPLGPDASVSARVHGGRRDVWQALSVPLAAQLPPTSSGGIVDLDRDYGGLGLQYTQRARLGAGLLRATAGVELEAMSERRRGYLNDGGVQGELRRDEDDTVGSRDAFVQLAWTAGAWTLVGGLRMSRIEFEIDDDYVAPGNPDDSGRRRYDAVNPVAGLTWHATDTLNVYANAGRGFETPTFAELAYRPDGGGPNLALDAARSTHAEIGAKWLVSDAQRLELALFAADTDDEIVVATSTGGRSSFRNAGRTTRRGVELAWTARLGPAWRARAAATLLHARFADGFGTGAGAVPAGNRLPGVPRERLFAELAWQPDPRRGPFAGLELLHTGSIAVDDRNTDAAPASTVAGLRAGWRHEVGGWRLAGAVRVDNVADARVVGSVIVNEGQRRFFEPAPGRAWFAGVSVSRLL
jgi:iron complex outermembrane receptor protein